MASSAKSTNTFRPGRTLIGFAIVVAMLYGLMALTGTWTPRLGLDLRGGTTITLTARTSDGSTVPRENLETARSIIQNRVDSLGVGESSVTIQGNDKIEVAVPNMSSDELVELVGATAKLAFRPVIAVQPVETVDVSTAEPTPDAKPDADSPSSPSPQTSGAEPSSAPASSAQRRPMPELPTEPPAPRSPRPEVPGEQPLTLDEQLNYVPTAQDAEEFAEFTCGDEFPDVTDQPLIACDETGAYKYFLGPVILSGERVTNASAGVPQGEVSWVVTLDLDAEGATIFADATEALAKKSAPQNQFAIVLDHEVVSAPSVNERIAGGKASISGTGITESSAKSLATTLRYGSLPVDLETSSVDTVSPVLGGNQMTAGIIAGVIGLLLVLVYSLIYYRGLTVVVAGSLVVAAIVTYAVMVLLGSAVGFALNLPGIAGAIIAIGITADSFVIYFERIRDEIREGHSLQHSIQSGWRKARGTILVADGVQLLAAVVLYFLAIGSVKGFAFTLGITTAIDLLLVIFFTHPLMTLLGRTAFYGQGHKFSGLDPEHLGVSRESLLGRRGRTRKRTKTTASAARKPGTSMKVAEASNE